MDRQELIERYNAFLKREKLQPTEVLVVAGGALTVYGIREQTSDIDVIVPKEVWNILVPVNSRKDFLYPYDEVIDLHQGSTKGNIVDGVNISTINDTISLKRDLLKLVTRSPEKKHQDKLDIKALEKLRDQQDQ